MPVHDFAVAAREHRNLEPELPEARYHPVHHFVVLARVARVENQFFDRPHLHFHKSTPLNLLVSRIASRGCPEIRHRCSNRARLAAVLRLRRTGRRLRNWQEFNISYEIDPNFVTATSWRRMVTRIR